jgi:hypothetical protein
MRIIKTSSLYNAKTAFIREVISTKILLGGMNIRKISL